MKSDNASIHIHATLTIFISGRYRGGILYGLAVCLFPEGGSGANFCCINNHNPYPGVVFPPPRMHFVRLHSSRLRCIPIRGHMRFLDLERKVRTEATVPNCSTPTTDRLLTFQRNHLLW